jgi:hypothetical protein
MMIRHQLILSQLANAFLLPLVGNTIRFEKVTSHIFRSQLEVMPDCGTFAEFSAFGEVIPTAEGSPALNSELHTYSYIHANSYFHACS